MIERIPEADDSDFPRQSEAYVRQRILALGGRPPQEAVCAIVMGTLVGWPDEEFRELVMKMRSEGHDGAYCVVWMGQEGHHGHE